MSFIHQIPLRARPSYYWYIRAQAMEGIFTGAALELINFVARKTVEVSDFQIAMFLFFISSGMMSGVLMPQLLRIRSKMQYIALTSISCKALFVLLAFVTDPSLFFLVAAAALFLSKMYIPINAAVLKNNFPETHRAIIFGHVRMVELIVTVLAWAAAGWVLHLNEEWYRGVFIVAGSCGIAGTLFFVQIPEKKINGKEAIVALSRVWRVLRTDRTFLYYELIFSVSGLANLIGLLLYILYLTDVIRASYMEIAIARGVLFNLTAALTLRWWGRLQDRHPNPMLIRGVLTFLWILQPLFFALAHDMVLIYVAYIYFGILMGGAIVNWMLGALYFCSDEEAAVYTSIHTWFNGIRGMIAPLLGYVLYRWIGFRATFCLISLVMLMNAFFMFGLYFATRNDRRFRSTLS